MHCVQISSVLDLHRRALELVHHRHMSGAQRLVSGSVDELRRAAKTNRNLLRGLVQRRLALRIDRPILRVRRIS